MSKEQYRPGPRHMLPLGRFFGVPIFFAPSWVLIAAIVTFYYGPVVGDAVPGTSDATAYSIAFAFAVAFAACVVLHELGHTAASLLLGAPVRRVVIFLLGGYSELDDDPKRPREEFFVAAAGPAVTLVLAGGAALAHQFMTPHTLPSVLIDLLFWSNLAVAIFNLLPALPLDGGRLLRSGIWALTHNQYQGTRFGAWAGRFLALAIAVAGLFTQRTALGLTSGVIAMVMAAYLWVGATQTLRAAELQNRLPALDVDALLRRGLMVPANISVGEAQRRAWQAQARGLVVVDTADRPSAIVDETLVRAIPPAQRAWTSITSVARNLEPGLTLPRGLVGEALLRALRTTPAREYLVVNDDGSPAGILATDDLADALKSA